MKGSGLKKKLELSSELSDFMGKDQASRTDVIKAIWVHIKAEGLQDENDGRIIHPDDTLKPLLGSRQLKMTEIAKKLNPHFV